MDLQRHAHVLAIMIADFFEYLSFSMSLRSESTIKFIVIQLKFKNKFFRSLTVIIRIIINNLFICQLLERNSISIEIWKVATF